VRVEHARGELERLLGRQEIVIRAGGRQQDGAGDQ
jgi:hypothetical protein